MPQTITPWQILTSGGKHDDREKSPECTPEVRCNAAELAERVSWLCDVLGIIPTISSGFRTTQANSAVGGSKSSHHLTGKAVDLADPDGKIARAILNDLNLLTRFDLYVENPSYTQGWIHIQTAPTKSGRRVFVP